MHACSGEGYRGNPMHLFEYKPHPAMISSPSQIMAAHGALQKKNSSHPRIIAKRTHEHSRVDLYTMSFIFLKISDALLSLSCPLRAQ